MLWHIAGYVLLRMLLCSTEVFSTVCLTRVSYGASDFAIRHLAKFALLNDIATQRRKCFANKKSL